MGRTWRQDATDDPPPFSPEDASGECDIGADPPEAARPSFDKHPPPRKGLRIHSGSCSASPRVNWPCCAAVIIAVASQCVTAKSSAFLLHGFALGRNVALDLHHADAIRVGVRLCPCPLVGKDALLGRSRSALAHGLRLHRRRLRQAKGETASIATPLVVTIRIARPNHPPHTLFCIRAQHRGEFRLFYVINQYLGALKARRKATGGRNGSGCRWRPRPGSRSGAAAMRLSSACASSPCGAFRLERLALGKRSPG